MEYTLIAEKEKVEIMTSNLCKALAASLEKAKNKGLLDGEEQGFIEGFIEGFMEGKIEVAKKLLVMGMDINKIKEVTELELEYIERLDEIDKEYYANQTKAKKDIINKEMKLIRLSTFK